MILFSDIFVELNKNLFYITDDGDGGLYVFAYLSSIYIYMYHVGMRGKGTQLAGYTVIETGDTRSLLPFPEWTR